MPSDIECSCGHHMRLPDAWSFPSTTCPNCGATVAVLDDDAATAITPRFCPVCGKKLLPQENWCTHCKAPIEELHKLRSAPRQAAKSGLCPACGQKLLPRETACPRCKIVVAEYLDQQEEVGESTGARSCHVCSTKLLPKETACPQCKVPV